MLEDPQKFSTSNFFNFLKNKLQNWLPRTWQISRGTKSVGMVNLLAGAAVFIVEGP